ncbi:MAG: glutamine--fructose-6-phosphate transaminase (isomerizing) [Gammaproteobacteria bacterium]|nr:glutamine--fructose-6-phosphate transaminase (isomerizing) [Gammaproteobacteria bacterium]
MCGIVAAIATSDVSNILIEGLFRLEYRGYDSAGIAVLNDDDDVSIQRVRCLGKVAKLQELLVSSPCRSNVGIAHTRWATHGAPDKVNAHPHISDNRIAIVHNGIIENYEALKAAQQSVGFEFDSETDTEVIAHQIIFYLRQNDNLLDAVSKTINDLEGAYSLAVLDTQNPGHIVLVREGSPLVIGIGEDANYAASDIQALSLLTQTFIHLENGDIAEIRQDEINIFNSYLQAVVREHHVISPALYNSKLGEYRHYMHKEIYDQPRVIADTLEGRLLDNGIPDSIISDDATEFLDNTQQVHIVACGTSYHAALVARYWLEEFAQISCSVEIASEFRYRHHFVLPNTLFVAISQSGETADTLAALQIAKQHDYFKTLAICNVPESSLTREVDATLMTHAGPEIGVASTKAFTTQLTVLLLLTILIAKRRGLTKEGVADFVNQLRNLPSRVEQILDCETEVRSLAQEYSDKHHALFLGRGLHYPIAMEGALKMKEISYIHAEAYAAGELKHGPLALVDFDMPVVAVAPNDRLLSKLKSNLKEVHARGGRLHVFADSATGFQSDEKSSLKVIRLNASENAVSPILFTIPLQLLAYHTALLRGTDIDQPRNLAKSVTVE